MQENHNIETTQTEEHELDLMEIAGTLWDNRRKIIKWGIFGAILGLVVAFSIPREYAASVKLAPELGDGQRSSGGLGALASIAGINTGSGGSDAVYPEIYPDIVSSVPFITSLFNVEVETTDNEKMTVEEYLINETSSPWWSVIMKIPSKLIGLLVSSEEIPEGHTLDNFRLTRKEAALVSQISERVSASIDDQNSMVSIDVKMQDPLVAAMLADTVVTRLQNFVTDYRTNKVRKDLEYAEKINKEAKQEYYRAQQALADYSDRNQGLATQSARIARDRLENEAQLAFALYNQTARQVQSAKAVVQAKTPVYVTISPSTVPNKPVSPRRLLILIGFTFVSALLCAAWVAFLKPLLEDFKANKKKSDVVS